MNSPTLLVGLGGTGSKIVAKVSEMISESQRRNISCVIFDTDANDIPEIKRFHPEIRVVQTSARMTVGEYLEADHYSRDTWFPVNPPLDRKVLSEGAGQVRSISRLGFESAVRAGGMQPLFDAIQDLYKVDNRKADQALRVTIVSSLAGGTGSGLIVPVAMFIRRYLEDNFHQNANISRGFFILPEVFYDAIPSDQRNNLKSNAYASLRELDAFLMKGNKTLSEEYSDSVRLELPVAGTDRHEEYDVSPYDFCFLFDAQNANGEKLNSLEQYMDHAANIIYSMSIGPMNKRSNSSEDNVIRKLAKEKGRNRYAGAGASRLIYPYDDICRLIGLEWASQSITDQWLVYDRQIRAKQDAENRKKEQGLPVEDIQSADEYVSLIKEGYNTNKALSKYIYNSVEQEDSDEPDPLYLAYMTALDNQIKKSVDGGSDAKSLSTLFGQVTKHIENVGGDADEMMGELQAAEQAMSAYVQEAERFISQKSRNLAYSLYKGAESEGGSDEKYLISTIIKNENKYLHPNAIRYLLIKVREELKSERESLAGEIREDQLNAALNKRYEAIENTLNDFEPKGIMGKSKRKKGYAAVADELQERADAAAKYTLSKVKDIVYEEGIAYLTSLIEAYEAFYNAFEAQLKTLDSRKAEIYNKYTQAPGLTVRYVAASRPALDTLLKRYPYRGSLISVDSELSGQIASKVFDFASRENKPNASRFFGDLFENQILPYYQHQVDNRVAGELDKGILKAIELEADLMLDEDHRESRMAVDRYVRDVIEQTRSLATPFIEKPNELNATAIDACAFNETLVPERGDETYEAKLIQEELIAKGGTGDEDVDKNTIMFYQSYYGLRANSLSKFAPPKNSETHHRNGGEYFSAYMELIRGIHPNSRLSQEITPHIDKRWHLAAKMPDLDEGNQVIEEYSINAAFFWALVLDLLELKKESSGKNTYELRSVRLGIEDGTLLKDGQQTSSKLYEVLDALAIQPAYVQTLRKFADQKIQEDIDRSVEVEQAGVYHSLIRINIPVEGDYRGPKTPKGTEPGEVQNISILSLPEIMRESMPVGKSRDKKLLDLLMVALKESVRYISSFCSPDEVAGKVANFMKGEFELYKANKEKFGENGIDALNSDALDTAANFLKEYGLYELAEEISKYVDACKKVQAEK